MEGEIVQTKETKKEIIPQQSKKEKGVANRFFSILREIIALLFWIYIPIKLFVFDIDVSLVNKYLPSYAWLLDFKFFILIGIIAVIWLITKNKHILSWSLYILFYPAIVLSRTEAGNKCSCQNKKAENTADRDKASDFETLRRLRQ